MHACTRMATTYDYELHDHAGIRWLLPFLAVVAVTVLVALLMMVYPHVVT